MTVPKTTAKPFRLRSQTWDEVEAYQARLQSHQGHLALTYAPEEISISDASRYLLRRGLAEATDTSDAEERVAVLGLVGRAQGPKTISRSVRLRPIRWAEVAAYRTRLEALFPHPIPIPYLADAVRYLLRRGLQAESKTFAVWKKMREQKQWEQEKDNWEPGWETS